MDILSGLLAALGAAAAKSATDIATKVSVARTDEISLFALNWLTSATILTVIAFFRYPALLVTPISTFSTMTTDAFWWVWFADGALNAVAAFYYIRAFKEADASLVAPLMLLTPIFMLVTSPLMLGERVSPMGAIGILLAAIGSYQLGKDEKQARYLDAFKALAQNRGVRSMLVTVTIWSVTSNLDKLGVKASTPLLWSWSISCFVAFCSGLFWLAHRNGDSNVTWRSVIPGVGLASQALLQNTALTLILAPYVISIKRTSAVFTVVLSSLLLGENIYRRLYGALIITAGTFLMILASYA
jgi:drug/metabolite transporter (DMT)-like permease